MPFRDIVERFRVYAPPTRPLGKPEVWLGGRRVEGRDYLFYSRLHLPTMHLSGLAATRLAPTLQAQIAFVNQPGARLAAPRQQSGDAPTSGAPVQPPGNLLVSLQHDTGRYSGEYTYSATDGMFGLRGLYNFAWQPEPAGDENKRRVDEEEMMDGGLRGRFSAGGEVFFSVKQKSLGRALQRAGHYN
jgi:distribution and morphology protein 10